VNLLADEGVDRQIVERLRADGHEVIYIAEMAAGMTDDDVLNLGRDTSSLLLTQDKDFGELVFRQGLATSGVLLIRLAGLEARAKAASVSAVIKDREAELSGSFSVLTVGSLRIRKP
jgi:predicted nuclease of predicted toxin-antitoxin system